MRLCLSEVTHTSARNGRPTMKCGAFCYYFLVMDVELQKVVKVKLLIDWNGWLFLCRTPLDFEGWKADGWWIETSMELIDKAHVNVVPVESLFHVITITKLLHVCTGQIHEWNWFPLVQSTLTLEGVIRSVVSRGSNLTLSLQVCTQACPFDCQITYCTHHWRILYFKYIKDLLHLLLSKGAHPHYSLTGYFLMNHACLLSVNYHKRQLISEKYNWIKQWPSNRNSLQYKELVFKFCAWQI